MSWYKRTEGHHAEYVFANEVRSKKNKFHDFGSDTLFIIIVTDQLVNMINNQQKMIVYTQKNVDACFCTKGIIGNKKLTF